MALLAHVGCGPHEETSQDGIRSSKPVVFSANHPLHCFAQRIGGDTVEAGFLVPPEVDPAFWEPASGDIARMQQADLVVLNGAGYEKWLPMVTLAESKLVDTSTGFRDHFITEAAGPSHQHGPGGEHSHGEIAFTTWLDLSLAIQQAGAVERALVRSRPDQAEQFAATLNSLTIELASLDRELLAWGKSMRDQPLLASHPVYQYFARRYGLNLKSVHWEPGQMPDATAWRELEAMLKEHPAKWMLWEGEPLEEVAARLRSLGVGGVVVAPLSNPPSPVDFVEGMKQNLLRLKSM